MFLAIEIDVTSGQKPGFLTNYSGNKIDLISETRFLALAALGVPELWRYSDGKLEIFVFQSGVYLPVETSPTFPNLPVVEGILEFLKIGATAGATAARRGFRQWLRSSVGG